MFVQHVMAAFGYPPPAFANGSAFLAFGREVPALLLVFQSKALKSHFFKADCFSAESCIVLTLDNLNQRRIC